MTLTSSGQLNQFLRVMQGYLFPKPKEQLSPLTDKLRQLIAVPEPIQIEAMVGPWRGGVGRPARHERAIARAFAGFAASELPQRLHAAPIEATQKEGLVGHPAVTGAL